MKKSASLSLLNKKRYKNEKTNKKKASVCFLQFGGECMSLLTFLLKIFRSAHCATVIISQQYT